MLRGSRGQYISPEHAMILRARVQNIILTDIMAITRLFFGLFATKFYSVAF